MKVTLKVIATAATGPAEKAEEPVAQETNKPMVVELREEANVWDLIQKAAALGVPRDKITMILVNGEEAANTTPLHDGDAVTIIGQVPGM